MPRISRALVGLGVLGLVAAGGYGLRRHWITSGAAAQPAYATAQVRRGSIQAAVSGAATLQPAHSATLTAPVGGTVRTVRVKQGQAVHSGEVLATLTDAALAQSITQAGLKVHAALEALAAATGTALAQAAGVNPQQGVTVRAPQAGRVTELAVSQGSAATAGEVLAKIVDSRTVVMDVALLPYDHALLASGAAARVHFSGFSGWVTGSLRQISPNGIPSRSGKSEVYPAEVVLTNPKLLQPGDKGQVQLRAGSTWLTLPQQQEISGFGREASVRSPIAATVQRVDVALNSWVRQGQSLLSLGGGGATAAISADQLALQQDEAALAALHQEQAALTVTAPLSGVVGSLDVQVGERVAGGADIARVYGPRHMTLDLAVSQLQVTEVKRGQAVQVTTPGLTGKTFTGSVVGVGTVGTSGSGLSTFSVHVAVDGHGTLLPGMSADARILTASARGVLLVPVEAVLQQSAGDEVEVLRHGQVSTVAVKVGLVNSTDAEILSGLHAGETVVTGASSGAMAQASKATHRHAHGDGSGRGSRPAPPRGGGPVGPPAGGPAPKG